MNNMTFLAVTSCVLKLIIVFLINLLAFLIYNCNINELERMKNKYINIKLNENEVNVRRHKDIIEDFYHERKDWKTSALGSILFQNETDYTGSKKYTYLIFVWKHWHWLRARHVYFFGKNPHNPLLECSVKNCKFTGKDEWFYAADAVLIHLPRGLLPNATNRKPYQRWIFLDDEAPENVYSNGEGTLTLSEIANVFNWSMSYRTDSDIPVPYGRTVPLPNSVFPAPSFQEIATLVPHWTMKRRDVLIAVLMSHCAVPQRMKYLSELKKFTEVDVYGRCADKHLANICPGHYNGNCAKIDEYLFYFVFERSMCRQYLTEKLFYYAYGKGAIPIIMGPPLQDCKALLPPHSFIHIDDFLTPGDLAEEIINISKDEEKLLSYHHWRNHFKIVNEHGYFGTKSNHLCRLCEALNYNDQSYRVYGESDIRSFLDESLLCNNIISRKRFTGKYTKNKLRHIK